MYLFSKIAWSVTLSAGWRRYLIAFSAGAVGALALSPINFFPAICVPLCTAVWLLDGSIHNESSFKAGWISAVSLPAARDGWWMGFGYFVAGLWWLGAAFFVEADKFAFLAPAAVLGLPAFLALFFAGGFFISRLLWTQSSWRCLSLAIGLGACEWLRSVVFTGFPWNNLGMTLAANLNFAQMASVIGLHGMTFIAVFVFSAPASLADNYSSKRIEAPLTAAVCLMSLFLGGEIRLSSAAANFESDIKLRIVQPNIEQGKKFVPSAIEDILEKHLKLSNLGIGDFRFGADSVSHFIWPESPFPAPLSSDPVLISKIAASLPETSILLTGAIRIEHQKDGQRLFFNSIHAISPAGEIVGNYDKQHLVPFGEYLPFATWLNAAGLRQFVHIPGGFSAGEGPKGLRVSGLPQIASAICYEAVFPGALYSASSERPGLILNVTNDAWFGSTPGPYQHFDQVRLRAIEEGVPLVRAANSGISAIVDPYGRVLKSLSLGVEGVLDGPLPSRIPATFFSRNPITAPGLVLFSMVLALGLLKRRA